MGSALRIGVIRDEPAEDVAPAVREACETAIEDLRGATGGEVREIELPELAAATLATVLIANSESLGGITPERLNNLDPELSPLGRGLLKYRVLLPAVATIKAQQLRTLARRTLAEVFEQVGAVVATSANVHGGPDPRSVDEVAVELRAGAAAIVDGGELPGTPSTVLDLTGQEPQVLREGAVPAAEALERALAAGASSIRG